MVSLIKKNMVSGIIVDLLGAAAVVVACRFVISLIEKKPFARTGAGRYGFPRA